MTLRDLEHAKNKLEIHNYFTKEVKYSLNDLLLLGILYQQVNI